MEDGAGQVLVLAPDAGFRVTAAGALRDAGLVVHTVGRATAALDLLERQRVELMVVHQQGEHDLGRYFMHQLDALALPTALLLLVPSIAPFDDLRASRRRVLLVEGTADPASLGTIVRGWRDERGLASLPPISLGDWIDAAVREGGPHRLRVEVGDVALGQVLVSEGEVIDASLPGARGLAALDVLGRLPQAHVHVEPWRPGRSRTALAWTAVVPSPVAEVRGFVGERLLAGDGPIGRYARVERRSAPEPQPGRTRGPTSVFEVVDGAAGPEVRPGAASPRVVRAVPPPPDESQLPATLHRSGPHTPLDVVAVNERVRVISGAQRIATAPSPVASPDPAEAARAASPHLEPIAAPASRDLDPSALFDLAMDAYLEGCPTAAIQLLERCLSHDPVHRWARFNLDRLRARRRCP